ncbi:hypothetical protein J4G33_13250 [Actinotalea sp. BY-33]|uniref:Uncharacterized protein n=1 Tax=Actinotalea soli TaxID=2819234 RepID=A0A939LRL9_9CELL|nr:hypothetical protein [Actinotalea soli]MBO1752773.1 hypothetical protein [Actinotalea soli]
MEPRLRRSDGAEIDVQIERIDRSWSTRDLTTAERHERYERLDGLREHLERAAAEGRSPEEVLNPDPVAFAFAAEWGAARCPHVRADPAHRHRSSRRAARAGSVLGGLLLLVGLGLAWTLLDGTGVSVTWPAAVVLVVLGAALTALQVRWSNRAWARRGGVTS